MDIPQIGQTWRPDTGGHPQVIVAIEDRIASVMRADSSKKSIDRAIARGPVGSQIVALSEFTDWTLIEP